MIDCFEVDYEYFIEGGVFINDLIEMWISFKCENEIELVNIWLYFYEFVLYYDV